MSKYSQNTDTEILNDTIDTLYTDAVEKLKTHGDDLPAIGMRVQAVNAMRKLVAERKRSK